MTGILGQLQWETFKKRRKDNRLILLYKGLKGKASVPTDDLIPKTRSCRNQHSMAFLTPIAYTDVYKGSFFPQTIRDWNALRDSLISSAEDAEDCVAKFTSLVRARVSTVSKKFKINLEGQNYVHFEVILSRNVKMFGIMVSVTHKSTVVCTVMCRQDGRGRFPVLLDDLSKCRTNSQRKIPT